MIDMVKDVLNWDMSDYEKIAIIEMIVEAPRTVPKYKPASEILKARYAQPAKPKVHKGPVAGTYKRGILWARCKKEHPLWAAKQVYGNLSNADMERVLARAAAKVK